MPLSPQTSKFSPVFSVTDPNIIFWDLVLWLLCNFDCQLHQCMYVLYILACCCYLLDLSSYFLVLAYECICLAKTNFKGFYEHQRTKICLFITEVFFPCILRREGNSTTTSTFFFGILFNWYQITFSAISRRFCKDGSLSLTAMGNTIRNTFIEFLIE